MMLEVMFESRLVVREDWFDELDLLVAKFVGWEL
jgi:hypothetical protein